MDIEYYFQKARDWLATMRIEEDVVVHDTAAADEDDEIDITTVLLKLGKDALLAALPPTLRNVEWAEAEDGSEFMCTITAKSGDLPSIRVWRCWRVEAPARITSRKDEFGEWTQPFIGSAMSALRQQYTVLVQKEAQERLAAIESYKTIIAREYAASLGALLTPGEDMPAIVDKMEEMFVAVAGESSKATAQR
jgi:hypothetical protein